MKLRYSLLLLCAVSSVNAAAYQKPKLPKGAVLRNSSVSSASKRTVKNPTPQAIATFAGVIIVNDSKIEITNGTSTIKAGKVGFLAADTTIQGQYQGEQLSYRGIQLQVVGNRYERGALFIAIKNGEDVELLFAGKRYNAPYFYGDDMFVWAPVIHISDGRDPSITHLLRLKGSDFEEYITGAISPYNNNMGASKVQVSNRATLMNVLKTPNAVAISPVKKPKVKKPKKKPIVFGSAPSRARKGKSARGYGGYSARVKHDTTLADYTDADFGTKVKARRTTQKARKSRKQAVRC